MTGPAPSIFPAKGADTTMAEATQTATDSKLELTPPDPVPTVSAERAAGLVPVSEEKKSKLDE